ncbi:MAG: ferredoxin [Frankiales bacterium]|nr:ferredoxin [Frankiales bacterium]
MASAGGFRAVIARTCIVSGTCEALVPSLFEIDDDGAHVLLEPVPDNLLEAARDAADQCPSRALTVIS